MTLPTQFSGSGAPTGRLFEGASYQREDAPNGGLAIVHNGGWVFLRRVDDGDFGSTDIITTGKITGTKIIAVGNILLVADDSSSPAWSSTAFGFGASSSGNGVDTFITGQTAFQTGNHDGGRLRIGGGAPAGTGITGDVTLELANAGTGFANEVGFEVLRLANTARRYTAINCFDLGRLTSTQMPAGTGDGVTYVRNAVVDPTTGKPVGGAAVWASGTVLRAESDNLVKTDLVPRGTIATGQGRPDSKLDYVSQVQTSGATTAALFSIDFSTLGDGIYELEVKVTINNVTDSTGAIIRFGAGYQVRSGTLTGIVYPWATSLIDAALTQATAQGAGANGASLASSIASPTLNLVATPSAGNTGKTLDWGCWVEVRRMAFT